MAMINIVIDDIRTFLAQPRTIPFMNERDLQMHLAIALKNSNNYDKVEVEYYVPNHPTLCQIFPPNVYPWGSEMKVDIVVEKDGEFVPIELKYKTKEIKAPTVERFGKQLNCSNISLIKNQGAENMGKYDFWRDVRRIELLISKFAKVKNGLVLFITNDEYYSLPSREGAICAKFSMENGIHGVDKHWSTANGNNPASPSRPGFSLSKQYGIEWVGLTQHNFAWDKNDNTKFNYLLINI